ncbi:sulfotransferase [Coraliomargarita akajimensis]|uniref:Sulfotransferase n=1 Tax=Coraliomargarita akajimensis (strain DSM 45221 / IAM 15411 / JCM 23193 / KCTC 12865 / 04OKA010-24) TaxID=583355 RepID=D5ENC7_CORAD|nr:sulfotransferase [Coraliomargarita akajimensis]ADE55403.1 hypothetical protein Caka_2387 [Coraliomargarita akajimensis DSM 45221]
MLAVFLKSVGLHLSWFARSLLPGKHSAAPLSLKRVCLLLLAFPLFCSLQLLHWLGFLIDEILFRGYRKQSVKAPVFIGGIPRSGTTFVHRTLAADYEQFTTVSTWEAVLAPSVTERKLIQLLAKLDHLIGAPGKRFLNWASAKAAGDFNDIHEVSLTAPEEDYLWLLPAGSCFILLLAFPFSPWLKQTALLNSATDSERTRLLDFYQSCIQRHLYCSKGNQRFLSKNAAFASWTGSLAARFPDASFILCVREPASGLSSQLSSLDSARTLFATDPDGSTTKSTFLEIFSRNYQYLAELTANENPRFVTIDQGDLRTDPAQLLGKALERLEIPQTTPLQHALSQLQPTSGSRHQHSSRAVGLENGEIEVCLNPGYQMVLQAPCRVAIDPQQHG